MFTCVANIKLIITKKMNKFGLLIAVLALTLVSCTNNKKQAGTQKEAGQIDKDIIDSHTADMSLDWAGVYEGVLPCADCEGIETTIELKKDHTYIANYKYLGKPADRNEFSEMGTFAWDEMGSIITLESERETSQYQVGENKLTLLTAEGNVNTGELAHLYELKKKM